MRLKRVFFSVALGAALMLPAQARADWLFTPFVGVNMHRDNTGNLGFNTKNTTTTFGGSLGYMGAGIFGFEVDFGYAPKFFDNEEVTTIGGNLFDLMGNVLIGVPIGGQHGVGVRPYVVGGAGLLRSRVNDAEEFFSLNENSFGIDAGGGVMVFFTDRVGVRGDLRYFRSLRSNDGNGVDLTLGSFDFWRASGGVTFRF